MTQISLVTIINISVSAVEMLQRVSHRLVVEKVNGAATKLLGNPASG